MFLKNKNIIFKIRRSKVTDYAALSGTLDFTVFGFKNAKNQLFEENNCFNCSFCQIEVQVITNQSSRLDKTSNT